MLKVCCLVALVVVLSACQSTSTPTSNSDVTSRRQMIHALENQDNTSVSTASSSNTSSIASRRQMIQNLEDQDYTRMRQKRKDWIEDLGEAQMNQAEAINKANENISQSHIYIIH